MILTGAPGEFFVVLGWLDNSILLVQTNSIQCAASSCPNAVWTVSVDGSNLTRVADGTFLTLVDGYKP